MRPLTLISASVLCALWSPTSAKEIIYANTCNEQESGDVAGYVVAISAAKNAPLIRFSWTEGSLKGPAHATVTDYDRKSGRLAFSAQTQDGDIFKFSGTIHTHTIDGVISSPWEKSTLHIELQERSDKDASEPKGGCPVIQR